MDFEAGKADITDTQMAYDQMPGAQGNPFKGDDKLLVRFRLDLLHNEAKSVESGRPKYDEVPFVRVQVPGDKDNVIDEPVCSRPDVVSNPFHPKNYPQRFPKLWAAFKAGISQDGLTGTPLEKWSQIPRNEVVEMAHFGVKTVEHLAGMSDAVCQRGMGWTARRQAAQDFLAASKDSSHITQMRDELNKRDALLAGLQKQHDDLVASLAKAKK